MQHKKKAIHCANEWARLTWPNLSDPTISSFLVFFFLFFGISMLFSYFFSKIIFLFIFRLIAVMSFDNYIYIYIKRRNII